MLEKIKYQGFEITSSQFTEHREIAGGRYNVSVNECEFTSGFDEEESKNWAQLSLFPSIEGYEDSANAENVNESEPDPASLAFEVKLKLFIYFEVEGSEVLTQEFFEKNSWFFENYMALSIKFAVESVLKHTPLNTIKLPWSMPADASLITKDS